MMIITNLIRFIAIAAFTLVLSAGDVPASQEQAGPDTAPLTDIRVSFKLDSRLTQGMYMGELWVSPRTYIGASGQDAIEARALGIDDRGRPVNIHPEWMPADPEMVTVTPVRGNEVKITVRRTGQSSLKVATAGFSKELFLKARYEGNALQVEISGGQVVAAAQQETKKDTKSQKERLSYSFGYITGSRMKMESMDIDHDVFIKAFREGLAGDKSAMTRQEMSDTLGAYQKELKAKQTGKKKESAEKNKKDGEAFLAENALREGVVTLPSGLQYKIIREGAGKQPTKSDKVKVHYRGVFINGTEFDSSYKKGKPVLFSVIKAIKGWSEALQLMKEGSKWMLYVSSDLAYGERGARKIGPNQTLVFEVELISVH